MLNLAWPAVLAVLPLPLLIYWLMPPAPSVRTALNVPFYAALATFCEEPGHRLRLARLTLLTVVWILLVVAAARPQWAGEATGVPVSGRDLMLAVDVSGSMKTRDMVFRDQPQDRLATVKRVAGEFIDRRTGDRVGLILFGTRAYLQTPLTLDRETVNTLLQESAIGIAGEKTAIGDAIGLALKRLKDRPGEERLLVLLTDGSNTAGTIEPLRAAELARVANLKIHTIGVGADSAEVQTLLGTRRINPSAELDEATLARIAELTGGRYFRARDGDALAGIYRLIDQLEPVEGETSHLRPTRELFHFPLGLALLVSLLAAAGWGGLLGASLPGRDTQGALEARG